MTVKDLERWMVRTPAGRFNSKAQTPSVYTHEMTTRNSYCFLSSLEVAGLASSRTREDSEAILT